MYLRKSSVWNDLFISPYTGRQCPLDHTQRQSPDGPASLGGMGTGTVVWEHALCSEDRRVACERQSIAVLMFLPSVRMSDTAVAELRSKSA